MSFWSDAERVLDLRGYSAGGLDERRKASLCRGYGPQSVGAKGSPVAHVFW
jgi:hypothetical protein